MASESEKYCEEAERIKSFNVPHTINKKKYSWRYTVIPADMLAKIGFYHNPRPNKDNKIQADSIKCIYCNRSTIELKKCRAKNKDVLVTISNVLELHIGDSPSNCLLCYLRLKLLKDSRLNSNASNWDSDKWFDQPLKLSILRLFEKTFKNNSKLHNKSETSVNRIARAGLIKYDSSYTSFKEESYVKSISPASTLLTFCIYSKTIIPVSINLLNDDVQSIILLHHKQCNSGKCHFFKMLRSLPESPEELSEEYLRHFEYDYSSPSRKNSSANNSQHTVNSVIRHTELYETSGDQNLPKSQNVSDKIHPNTSKENNNDNDLNTKIIPQKRKTFTESASKRQTRKLLRSSPQRISASEFSFADKEDNHSVSDNEPVSNEITINFKSHVQRRKKQLGKSNKLLDDNDDSDLFSFSAHGHSTFEIPAQVTIPNIQNSAEPIIPFSNKKSIDHTDDSPLGKDSSPAIATPNLLFSTNKITLLPETNAMRGNSSPDFVTALSVVSKIEGTPSKQSADLVKTGKHSGHDIKTLVPRLNDSYSGKQDEDSEDEPEAGGTPSRSIDTVENKGKSTPLTENNLKQHNTNVVRMTKLSHVPMDVSLSSSSEISDNDSRSSTPIPSPQHYNANINIKTVNRSKDADVVHSPTNQRLRHLKTW